MDALGPTKTYTTYTVESFKIGQYVSIFGRPMYIHDCDSFTREYCIKSLGYPAEEVTKISVMEPEIPLPTVRSEFHPPSPVVCVCVCHLARVRCG